SLPNVGVSGSVSVVDQNTVWIAGGPVGTPVIWRTTNAGSNWISIPTTGISFELYCIWAVDLNTAFVGNGGQAGRNSRFYKTTNSGINWTEQGSTGGGFGVFDGIVFSKTEPSFGIAVSDPPMGQGQPYYVSKTTNGGNTWTDTNPSVSFGLGVPQNTIVVINAQFYGWGTNAPPIAFIVTTDGGNTWNKRIPSIGGPFTTGIAFKDRLTGLFAGLNSFPNISRTTDGGVTWATINTGSGVTGWCNLKWIDGTNTCYLTSGDFTAGSIKKSTNGGLNWTPMTVVGPANIHHFEYKRVGTSVFAYGITAGGLVLKLNDEVVGITPINSLIPDEYKLEQNYPNPFNPTTTINFSIPTSSKVTLTIYDALGKEIETIVDEFKQAGNYSADFTAASTLTSGVYFYTIQAANFTDTKKINVS
ncbi:MAG: T9SS type A sorting domain-containing protein, partial [Bacteroidota bacterium]|nr:T9SS type A sorting domain-containing protein [Bacteroidota bacterium]